ncbi:uncharacterized protein LOC131208244 [Anopheles bellator]|uniref:uncharacterized protein LOC131208244 n=1 Tax=Anopheles bellator TaxID=139047 RepID=UPI002647C82D|nr:uncharacterized protein LOC131208244 [Anopheles bellator]
MEDFSPSFRSALEKLLRTFYELNVEKSPAQDSQASQDPPNSVYIERYNRSIASLNRMYDLYADNYKCLKYYNWLADEQLTTLHHLSSEMHAILNEQQNINDELQNLNEKLSRIANLSEKLNDSLTNLKQLDNA